MARTQESTVRAWLCAKFSDLVDLSETRNPITSLYAYDAWDLVGKLRALADEGEMRLKNPNFPETK